MATLRNVLLAILAVLIQASLAHKLSIFNIRPDFVLLAVIYVGVTAGHAQGTILGFAAGLVQDACNPSHMGLNALAKSIVGFATGYGHGGVAIERPLVRALLILLAALVHDLVYFLIYTGGHLSQFAFLFLRQGLGSALYVAVLGTAFALLPRLASRLRSA